MPNSGLSEGMEGRRGGEALHRNRALGPFLCKCSSDSLRNAASIGRLLAGLMRALLLAQFSARGSLSSEGPGLPLLS